MLRAVFDKLTHFSFIRFLMSGGFNTALTYAIYLLLLNLTSYQVSYSVAYGTGILIAFLLNRFFVFKTHQGLRSILLFPLVYVAQYLASLGILWVWIDQLHLDARLGPLAAIVLTIPLTYGLSKLIFGAQKPSD
ncbi:GtrA family protein [Pseudomonas eucalypticola]|nr:GtrA family protein [Pseudomonas eucalypticola]